MTEFFRSELTSDPTLVLTKDLLTSSRIPRNFWNCELSKIPDKFAYKTSLVKYLNSIQQNDRDGKSLYLHGAYGRGKTGAAVALVKEAMRRGARVCFVSALELDSIFGKGQDEEYRKAILNTHFLIFDDLGAEKQIPWSPQWLETIIKLRNNNNLPTFITSNDKPIETMQRIKSIASLLGAKYDEILVEGHNWRLDGAPSIEKK